MQVRATRVPCISSPPYQLPLYNIGIGYVTSPRIQVGVDGHEAVAVIDGDVFPIVTASLISYRCIPTLYRMHFLPRTNAEIYGVIIIVCGYMRWWLIVAIS